MRAQVIAAARRLGIEVAELGVRVSRLEASEGVFLTNSLIGLRAVSSLEGQAFADHPLRVRLAAALSDVT
jgi:branched-subunit amino acid aminotransferase/4-amino-4-deoxychorismate lyase